MVFMPTDPPLYANQPAIRTPFGTLITPGGNVAAYVGSQIDSNDSYVYHDKRVATLQQGLARCRPGAGDTVVILHGHTESISAADAWSNLVAGTRIVAAGHNLFTFDTSTAASVLLDQADVSLLGLKFDCTGVDNLAQPITVSAARCAILGCEFLMESGTEGVVGGILLASGDGARLIGNSIFGIGEADAHSNGLIRIGGTQNDILIADSYISGAGPGDTIGHIHVATAATNVRIVRNTLIQLESTNALAAITVADVAATGSIVGNRIKLSEDNTLATSGLTFAGTSPIFMLADNLVLDNVESASGALSPAVGT